MSSTDVNYCCDLPSLKSIKIIYAHKPDKAQICCRFSKHRWNFRTLFREKKKKSVSATSGTDKICLTHILADFAKSTGKSEESCFCLYVMVRQFCIFML